MLFPRGERHLSSMAASQACAGSNKNTGPPCLSICRMPLGSQKPVRTPCPDDPPANPFVVNTNDVIHPIPLSDPPLPHRARFRSLPPPRRTGIDRGRRRPWRRRRRYCGIFMAWLPINSRQIDSWRPPTPTPTLNRWQTLHHDHNRFASRLGQRDLVGW